MAADSDDRDATVTAGGRCPICGKPSQHDHRPFCSRRCADIDLGRWLSGGYVIAKSADDDEDGEQLEAPDPDRNDGGTTR